MTSVRHIQSAFVAGELSPLLGGRTDSELYEYGLERCENFVPINEGPLVKRPGFEYICDADPTASWLGTFKFSISQEYVIEFANLKARFYTNGGRIEPVPGVAYEVTTPYLAAQASQLSSQQSFDRLYWDHPAHPPASLLRTGAEEFDYVVQALNNGPFLDQNSDETVKVTVSGGLTVGAVVTVTATAPIFEAGDVGSPFKIEAEDFSTIKAWQPGARDVPLGTIYRSDGKAYTSISGPSNAGSVTPEHDRGAEWDGPDINMGDPGSPTIYGIKWEYRHDRYGVLTITGYTSPTVVTGTVERRLPDSLTSVPSWRWAAGAFSARRGWPSIVRHWAGRQIHIKDYDLHGSVVGDFGGGAVNFEAVSSSGLVTADLAFRRTLETEDPPLWAVADKRGLLMGTASKELVVSAINPQVAISGENISNDPESFYGSEAVQPAQIGTRTMFVERGARRVRAAGYDLSSDRYVPEDLTAAARHVTASGVIQLTWHRVPHGLLYGVRSDGQLVVHADTRLQIKGWSRTVLGGGAKALSAVTVFGEDGKTDELWLLIERTRADGVKREIWKQRAWRELGDPAAEAFFVDCGTIQAATAGQTVFTGAMHLAGQDISVLAGGGVIGGITVSGAGTFTLPAEAVPADAYTLVIGLPYVATATTLRANAQTSAGSTQGLRQRIRKVVLRVLESMGIAARSDDGRDEQLIDRAPSDHMDTAPALYSGDVQSVLEAEYDKLGQATYTSALPLPATITWAMLGIEISGSDA